MFQQHQNAQVTVVGGGIGGLTAALLLARIGARVTLVEQRERPAEIGAGIMLQPNGLAVLEGLGLATAIRQHGHRLTQMAIHNQRGELVAGGAMPDFGAGLDHYVAVLRSDLHQELLEAVRSEPGIVCRFGVAVSSADPTGTVRLPAGGDEEAIRADLVVGADGVSSVVRAHGEFGAVLSDRQTTYVRGLVSGEGPSQIAEYWTDLGAFGTVPVRPGLTYFYAAAYREAAAAAIEQRDLAAFTTVWRRALPLAGTMLDRVPSMDALLVNGVRRVRCRRWTDGRLVLLGDAAHAMAPNLGQGANSALVDAAVLTAELAGPGPVESALARYERRRRRSVTRIQSVADGLARLSGLRGHRLPGARDAALRLLSRSPQLMGRQIRSGQQEDPATLLATVRGLGL